MRSRSCSISDFKLEGVAAAALGFAGFAVASAVLSLSAVAEAAPFFGVVSFSSPVYQSLPSLG